MRRVTINDPTTNRTAPQQPRQRCPEGLESYKAVPAPGPPQKPKPADPIEEIVASSDILNSLEGRTLGESPLDFLREHLPEFTESTKIFETRALLPRTEVAADFHAACDNVPNVLVIIKSGQSIAGGYTEVPFESREYDHEDYSHFQPNLNLTTFLFSVNKQTLYPLKESDKDTALNSNKEFGPSFGWNGLIVADDYSSNNSVDRHSDSDSSFKSAKDANDELFGTKWFTIDEYEVYKLE